LAIEVTAATPATDTEPADTVAARLKLARWAMTTGDHAGCVALGQVLYAELAAAGDWATAADVAVLLAKDCANNLNAELAMLWADRGQQAAVLAGDAQMQAMSCVVMASTHAQEERPAQAIAAMQQALGLLDDHMAIETRRTVFTGVGLSYASMGMPLQALDALRKAVDITLLGTNPLQRARARVNVLYVAVEGYDLLLSVDPTRAASVLTDALQDCQLLENDAQLADNPHARASYCHGAGMVMFRAGRLDLARALLSEVSVDDERTPAMVKRDVLIDLGRVAQAQGDTAAARACAQRAGTLNAMGNKGLRHARDLLQASILADLQGDMPNALALHKRYHARVVSNEHAAFDARVAELSATVAAQSMRLEISDLQARNAGLSSTFKQLTNLALTDALTGAANRRGLEEGFARLRDGGQAMVLAMLDLDHFKQINDKHSHGVGDQVLRQAGRLIADSLRDRDLLGRYGGEEFTALLVETSLPEAVSVAERLRQRVQDHAWQDLSEGLGLTLSVGIVTVRPGEAFEQAVARADVLLYAAKTQGRNRVLAECVEPAPTDRG
jgi:diguanylate cyclase (GGDEF)-like protein